MKKNLIIVLETVVIIFLGILVYKNNCFIGNLNNPTLVFHWPAATLKENERIVSVFVSFQATRIKSIRNIPAGWYVDLDQDVPPNPIFKGSIIVGTAALYSTDDLPIFELENAVKAEEAKPIKVEYLAADYSGNQESQRKIEINLNKP
jgi:hypothetical protein